jgi:hypothetical protein
MAKERNESYKPDVGRVPLFFFSYTGDTPILTYYVLFLLPLWLSLDASLLYGWRSS